MGKTKLKKILHEHLLYLNDAAGGVRANLWYTSLREANLEDAILRRGILRGTNLECADLRCADLREARLEYANLRCAILGGANLECANLREANLRSANLREANLRSAGLLGADLRSAALEGANLEDAILPDYLITPAGTIVGYKKIRGKIIALEIPSDARRMNPLVSRKCRAEFAKVVAIDGDTTPKLSITGGHDPGFTYTVGEIVHPDSYNDDIRIECTHGIHFFITEKEAMEY